MRVECDWVEEHLGGASQPLASRIVSGLAAEGVGPGGSAEESLRGDDARAAHHLRDCAECRGFARDLARIDALLLSEPVPAPPLDLGAAILSQVAARQRAELAWARSRALAAAALVLACGAVVFSLAGGFDDLLAPSEWGLSTTLWAQGEQALAGARSRLDALVTLPSAPAPLQAAWGSLLGLAPLLLIVNWAVGRGALRADPA